MEREISFGNLLLSESFSEEYPGETTGIWEPHASRAGGTVADIYIYIYIYSLLSCLGSLESSFVEGSDLGGPSGKSFRLVRACLPAECMSTEIGVKFCGPRLPFSLFLTPGFPFSLEDPPPP